MQSGQIPPSSTSMYIYLISRIGESTDRPRFVIALSSKEGRFHASRLPPGCFRDLLSHLETPHRRDLRESRMARYEVLECELVSSSSWSNTRFMNIQSAIIQVENQPNPDSTHTLLSARLHPLQFSHSRSLTLETLPSIRAPGRMP